MAESGVCPVCSRSARLNPAGLIEPHRRPTKEPDAEGHYGRECEGAGRKPSRLRK